MNRHTESMLKEFTEVRSELVKIGVSKDINKVAAMMVVAGAVRAFALDFVENIRHAGEGI